MTALYIAEYISEFDQYRILILCNHQLLHDEIENKPYYPCLNLCSSDCDNTPYIYCICDTIVSDIKRYFSSFR